MIFCLSFAFMVDILICSILDHELELDDCPESLRTMKYYLRNLRPAGQSQHEYRHNGCVMLISRICQSKYNSKANIHIPNLFSPFALKLVALPMPVTWEWSGVCVWVLPGPQQAWSEWCCLHGHRARKCSIVRAVLPLACTGILARTWQGAFTCQPQPAGWGHWVASLRHVFFHVFEITDNSK